MRLAVLLISLLWGTASILAETPSTKASAETLEPLSYPIAILPLKDRGREVDGLGQKLSDLLFAQMISDPMLLMVEREEFDQVVNEAELNLSAMVDPNNAIALGRLTGAKLVITGSVFQTNEKLFAVAKIISTETTRVVGASANAPLEDPVDQLAETLASEILNSIRQHANTLVAPEPEPDRFAEEFQQRFKASSLPSVSFRINERHVGANIADPAVETELSLMMSQCGFEVLKNQSQGGRKPDLVISGEAISEFASRRKGLVSVKARVELKAVDQRTNQVTFVDRQTDIALGLAEQITAKDALQKCAAKIARRMLPKLAAPDEP